MHDCLSRFFVGATTLRARPDCRDCLRYPCTEERRAALMDHSRNRAHSPKNVPETTACHERSCFHGLLSDLIGGAFCYH
jgi:hypothetical protein